MSDFSYTEESDENDYSQLKKNIQKIIKFTKKSEEDKSEDSLNGGRRKKKKSSRTNSEDLFKQFVELREFQKNLAKVIPSDDKDNSQKPTKPQKAPPKKKRTSSEERQSDSHSSLSLSSLSDKAAPQSKRDRTGKSVVSPDDDDGIDGDSDLTLSDDSVNEATKQDVPEETDSCQSSALQNNANLSEVSRRNSTQSIRSSECPSDLRANSPVVSQTELKRIKEFCRSIIIKEKQSSDRRTHSLGESLQVTESENCSISKKHDSNATPDYLTSSSRSEDTKITKIPKKTNGKKNEKLLSQRNHSTPDAESHTSMGEENTTRTRSIRNNNEQTETDDLNSEQTDFNTYGKEDQFDRSSDLKKLERINDQYPSNNPLEIIPRESSEVEYLKQCKNHEIEVAIKKEGGEKKLDDDPQEHTDLKDKYNLYNQSDDELMRRTVQEQVEEIMKVEVSTSTSVPEQDSFPFEDIGDGDINRSKVSLEDRIDHLQEEIQKLRKQLEEAKQYNQKEAKELCYISDLFRERDAHIIRNGLEWEDWELKEMVRERLREKREAAALDYQTRLRVVEALCSAELGKLEEALETLVPLNAAASSWGSPYRPPELRSSWLTQDYFLEVITSMNLSSSNEKTLDGAVLTNGELPPPAVESKPESQ